MSALRRLSDLGPTNPIVVRIVQGGSRRQRHLYIRTAYLAVLIAVLLWALLINAGSGAALSYRQLAAAGAESFQLVAYLQIALICLLTPVFMAGAIAQEASPRTWDVLLTTPLSAAQIVLGALLGRLFFIAALLFSSLPLFAITQYFGGVPGSSIFASYAIALGAALLVGSIAIFLSVSRIAGKRSVFAFFVAIVSYLGVTIAIDIAIRPSSGGVTALTAVNPFLALHALLNPTAYPRPEETLLAARPWIVRAWLGSPVTTWCVLTTVFSALLVAVSSVTARTASTEGGRTPLLRRVFGLGASAVRARPPRAVWHNPIAWREAAARSATLPRTLARWGFLASGALWGVGLVVAYHAQGLSHEQFRFWLLATVFIELAVITVVGLNLSATAVSREREDGTLDLLLTTPITPKLYLSGKLRGLIAYLAPMLAVPLCTIALAGLYVLIGGLGRAGGVRVPVATTGGGTIEVPVVAPEAAILAPLVCVPFVAFVCMVGLNWSLKSRSAITSVVATVLVVGVIALVLSACGWQAGSGLPYVGPAIAALSPASLLLSLIDPETGAGATINNAGIEAVRVSTLIGAIAASGIYIALTQTLRSHLVRRFDFVTRQLAGR